MFLCQRPLLLAQSSVTIRSNISSLVPLWWPENISWSARKLRFKSSTLFLATSLFSGYLLVLSLSSIVGCRLTLGFLLQGLSHYKESRNSHLKGLQKLLIFIIQNVFNLNFYYKQYTIHRYTSVDSWNQTPWFTVNSTT